MIFYVIWATVIALGVGLRVLELKRTSKPVAALALIAGAVVGFAMMKLRPFNFADGGLYMEGLLLSAACALALAGYLAATLWFVVRAQIGRV